MFTLTGRTWEAHGEVGPDLLVAPHAYERGDAVDVRGEPLQGQPGCHVHGILFGNADVDEPVAKVGAYPIENGRSEVIRQNEDGIVFLHGGVQPPQEGVSHRLLVLFAHRSRSIAAVAACSLRDRT